MCSSLVGHARRSSAINLPVWRTRNGGSQPSLISPLLTFVTIVLVTLTVRRSKCYCCKVRQNFYFKGKLLQKLSFSVLGLSVLLSSGLQANVLTNGGFETGDFSSWTVNGGAVVCAGASPFCGVPYEGTFSVTLNSGDSAPTAVLDQAFLTGPGTFYQVSFAYGIMDFVGGASQQLQVEIISSLGGAHDLLNQTVTSPPSVLATSAFNAPVNYQLFTFGFIADDTSATLQFTDVATNPTGSIDGKLDAASVDTPEPGSLLLLAAGLAAMFMGRLKRFTTPD